MDAQKHGAHRRTRAHACTRAHVLEAGRDHGFATSPPAGRSTKAGKHQPRPLQSPRDLPSHRGCRLFSPKPLLDFLCLQHVCFLQTQHTGDVSAIMAGRRDHSRAHDGGQCGAGAPVGSERSRVESGSGVHRVAPPPGAVPGSGTRDVGRAVSWVSSTVWDRAQHRPWGQEDEDFVQSRGQAQVGSGRTRDQRLVQRAVPGAKHGARGGTVRARPLKDDEHHPDTGGGLGMDRGTPRSDQYQGLKGLASARTPGVGAGR